MNLQRLKSTFLSFVGFSKQILVPAYSKTLSTSPPSLPVVEKYFVNRNPRNLEFMGIAWRQVGWKFQYPPRDFYHRVIFERTNRHTAAYVEHCSGKKVISASTKELAIARHLYSNVDSCAAVNIGRVLAQRCQESGITEISLQPGGNSERSEKFESFQKALVDGGIELQEPPEVVPDYDPGINYSDERELEDLQRRQMLVHKLGEKSRTIKTLNIKKKLRGRRRPWPRPTPLESPSYTYN